MRERGVRIYSTPGVSNNFPKINISKKNLIKDLENKTLDMYFWNIRSLNIDKWLWERQSGQPFPQPSKIGRRKMV